MAGDSSNQFQTRWLALVIAFGVTLIPVCGGRWSRTHEMVFNGIYRLYFSPSELSSFYDCLCEDKYVSCEVEYELDSQPFNYEVDDVEKNRVYPTRSKRYVECHPGQFTDPGKMVCVKNETAAEPCRSSDGCQIFRLEFKSSSCDVSCMNMVWRQSGTTVSFANLNAGVTPQQGLCSQDAGTTEDQTTTPGQPTTNAQPAPVTNSSASTGVETNITAMIPTRASVPPGPAKTETRTATPPGSTKTTRRTFAPPGSAKNKDGDGDNSVGLGVGLGVSIVVVAVIGFIAAFLFWRRRKLQEKPSPYQDDSSAEYVEPQTVLSTKPPPIPVFLVDDDDYLAPDITKCYSTIKEVDVMAGPEEDVYANEIEVEKMKALYEDSDEYQNIEESTSFADRLDPSLSKDPYTKVNKENKQGTNQNGLPNISTKSSPVHQDCSEITSPNQNDIYELATPFSEKEDMMQNRDPHSHLTENKKDQELNPPPGYEEPETDYSLAVNDEFPVYYELEADYSHA